MKKNETLLVLQIRSQETRAHALDSKGQIIHTSSQSLPVKNRENGWQESDPFEVLYTLRSALSQLMQSPKIGAITALALCITPETTCLSWDKDTGLPLSPLYMSTIHSFKAGINHILFSKKALIGSLDSWILYNLTGRQVHMTDHTQASQTDLFNLDTGYWNIPLIQETSWDVSQFPAPEASSFLFGQTKGFVPLPDGIPILSVVSEALARAIGLGNKHFGDSHIYYAETGHLSLNLGSQRKAYSKGSLSIYPQIGPDTLPLRYALQYTLPLPYSALKWISQPELIETPGVTQLLAQKTLNSGGAKIKQSLSGIQLSGLHADISASHLARAFYEAVAWEVKTALSYLEQETGVFLKEIKVSGLLSRHDMLMQFQADVLQIPIIRMKHVAPEILGAAFLAGSRSGFFQGTQELNKYQKIDKQFIPGLDPISSLALYTTWKES